MTDPRQARVQVITIRRPYAVFEPRIWHPALNIYETEQGVLIVAEVAGVDLADLHVHVHPTHVGIHGTRRLPPPAGLRRLDRMEIVSGPFRAEVPLDTPIDPDQAEGRYQNGMLEVWLPFAHQLAQRVVVLTIGGGPAQ